MTVIGKLSSAERLINASRKANFNLREYATETGYSISGVRLNGTVLGEKSASLKILIHDSWKKAIFAVVKSGKILGAKNLKGNYNILSENIMGILERLSAKGKITKEEADFGIDMLPLKRR